MGEDKWSRSLSVGTEGMMEVEGWQSRTLNEINIFLVTGNGHIATHTLVKG